MKFFFILEILAGNKLTEQISIVPITRGGISIPMFSDHILKKHPVQIRVSASPVFAPEAHSEKWGGGKTVGRGDLHSGFGDIRLQARNIIQLFTIIKKIIRNTVTEQKSIVPVTRGGLFFPVLDKHTAVHNPQYPPHPVQAWAPVPLSFCRNQWKSNSPSNAWSYFEAVFTTFHLRCFMDSLAENSTGPRPYCNRKAELCRFESGLRLRDSVP